MNADDYGPPLDQPEPEPIPTWEQIEDVIVRAERYLVWARTYLRQPRALDCLRLAQDNLARAEAGLIDRAGPL